MFKITTRVLLIAVISLSGFTSCKKDYICKCTTAGGTVYNSEIKTTKKKAESFCADQQTSGRTCELQ